MAVSFYVFIISRRKIFVNDSGDVLGIFLFYTKKVLKNFLCKVVITIYNHRLIFTKIDVHGL